MWCLPILLHLNKSSPFLLDSVQKRAISVTAIYELTHQLPPLSYWRKISDICLCSVISTVPTKLIISFFFQLFRGTQLPQLNCKNSINLLWLSSKAKTRNHAQQFAILWKPHRYWHHFVYNFAGVYAINFTYPWNLAQCAAVSTYCSLIRLPPHRNTGEEVLP